VQREQLITCLVTEKKKKKSSKMSFILFKTDFKFIWFYYRKTGHVKVYPPFLVENYSKSNFNKHFSKLLYKLIVYCLGTF